MQEMNLEVLSHKYPEFRTNYVQFLYILNHSDMINSYLDDIYNACVSQLVQLREADYIDCHQYATLFAELALKRLEPERRYYW